ncbi:Sortase family protein [compost metagenome]
MEPIEEIDGKTPIAIIEIVKIDLKLPVLEGASKENMRHAAAHMSDTAPLGEVGNAAIAAHRARKEGRLFNRLNEIELGDLIKITTKNEKYTYKVIKISVVEPTDISVLNSNNNDKWLTLITCTPLNKSTHRLIVQAELEE